MVVVSHKALGHMQQHAAQQWLSDGRVEQWKREPSSMACYNTRPPLPQHLVQMHSTHSYKAACNARPTQRRTANHVPWLSMLKKVYMYNPQLHRVFWQKKRQV